MKKSQWKKLRDLIDEAYYLGCDHCSDSSINPAGPMFRHGRRQNLKLVKQQLKRIQLDSEVTTG